jgi:IS5 family transposase
VHGYKAHVATDQDAALIRGVEITTANVHDAAELEAVLRRSRAMCMAIVPMQAVGPSA